MSVGHILANKFTAPDQVFVEVPHEYPWGLDIAICEMTEEQAVGLGLRPIKCLWCDLPATHLDAHYPYGLAHNACADHGFLPRRGWMQSGRSKWHYFDGHHSLCWRYELEVARPDLPAELPLGAEACHRCKERAKREEK